MRLKIIAGNLAVVVLLGLVAYFMVANQLKASLGGELDASIGNDRVMLERSFQLNARLFRDLVVERANTEQVRAVFGGLDLDSRRNRAYEAAESSHAWFGDPARGTAGAPDLVVVVDETGHAMARNGARNVMFGKALLPLIPALASVVKDQVALHDVWLENEQNKVLQVAIAPITSETGTRLGALLVGYDLSNGVAMRESRILSREIAFVVDDKVYSSSFRGSEAKELNGFLFGASKATTAAVLAGKAGATRPWHTMLAGNDYVGVTGRLPMTPSLPVGYAVLGNRTQKMALASAANVILMMLVLGSLMVIAYGFVVGGAIMRPIEEIEEGVLAVINGRSDLRLETDSAELGGLAYRINQLLNVMTGTEEAESEDAEGRLSAAPTTSAWKDAAFADGAPAGGAQAPASPAAAAGGAEEVIDDPAVAQKLAAEDDAAYQARLYAEYVAAKQALGENVSNIPQDRFMQRLSGRADALAKQHGCRMVRFQVHSQGNQVALRPVLIR